MHHPLKPLRSFLAPEYLSCSIGIAATRFRCDFQHRYVCAYAAFLQNRIFLITSAPTSGALLTTKEESSGTLKGAQHEQQN